MFARKNVLSDIFSYEKKIIIFLTGPQDNAKKGKRKKIPKRPGSAIRKNVGSGSALIKSAGIRNHGQD